jgi:hypothetical protein
MTTNSGRSKVLITQNDLSSAPVFDIPDLQRLTSLMIPHLSRKKAARLAA